jgi:hypothetical protein
VREEALAEAKDEPVAEIVEEAEIALSEEDKPKKAKKAKK